MTMAPAPGTVARGIPWRNYNCNCTVFVHFDFGWEPRYGVLRLTRQYSATSAQSHETAILGFNPRINQPGALPLMKLQSDTLK